MSASTTPIPRRTGPAWHALPPLTRCSSVAGEPAPVLFKALNDLLRERRPRLLDGGEEVVGRRALGVPLEVLALESALGPWGALIRSSGCAFVFVEQSAEPVGAADLRGCGGQRA